MKNTGWYIKVTRHSRVGGNPLALCCGLWTHEQRIEGTFLDSRLRGNDKLYLDG